MFHTQEKREKRLDAPGLCTRDDAWLGHGCYFWEEERDAVTWGNSSKTNTGSYEIYKGRIVSDAFLDTVFNEEHYQFWIEQIEKTANDYKQKTGKRPNIRFICSYLDTDTQWKSDMDGILFADSPTGKHSLVDGLPYRKRIQAVIYTLSCLRRFDFYKEGKCVKLID
ncbi:hypothetical protein EZS27_008395 [termite gut metagenome]|uniref:Uncharacterized protein n=1 Tax=termite gut metagenome TaxID=433724 RepID=A0A5J4SF97_9ZZZZ